MTEDPDSNSDAISELPSRRRFLTAAAATTTLAGVGSFAGAAQQSDAKRIALKGVTSGWIGYQPASIKEVTNPTLHAF